MKTLRRLLQTAAVMLLALPASLPVLAATPRTFVASTGNDTNACSRTAPCRTFGAAIAAVDTGGEVIVLDSAGYGPFSINKAVSVTAPDGVYASITISTGNAITIGVANNAKIVLRGLTLNDEQPTAFGIIIPSSTQSKVHVEKCVINGFQVGIFASVTLGSSLYVSDTVIRNGYDAIDLTSSAGAKTLKTMIDHCNVKENANYGVYGADGTQTVITESVAAGNGNAGFSVQPTSPSGVGDMMLERCVTSYNGTGVAAGGTLNTTAQLWVSNCTISNNTLYGVLLSEGGAIYSRTNNTIENNTSNNSIAAFYNAK